MHAEAVRVRPSTDGNGRTTRLLADLVFTAAQDLLDPLQQYDCNVDKNRYIALLREYDRHRNVGGLADSFRYGRSTPDRIDAGSRIRGHHQVLCSTVQSPKALPSPRFVAHITIAFDD